MTTDCGKRVDVFPAEKQEILVQNRLNIFRRELLSDRASVLVINNAARFIQHLPSAFPCHEPEVRVFQVERREQRIESAELEEFTPVESARSTPSVEARKKAAHPI